MPKQEPIEQENSMGGIDDMPPMDEPEDLDTDTQLNGADDDNQFDSNFDPGVEADEDTDPEKFIQQLTGKLSQSLIKYNNESEDDEDGINKYVLQMIAKQTSKGMDDSDKKEVIKTIKSTDNESDEDMDLDDDSNSDEIDDSEDLGVDENNDMDFKNESKLDGQMIARFTKKNLVESFGVSNPEMERKKSEKPEMKIPDDAPKNKRSKAFRPRMFK